MTKILIAALTALSGIVFWSLASRATVSSFGLIPFWALADLIIFLALLGISFLFATPWQAMVLVLLSASPIVYLLDNKFLAVIIIGALALSAAYPATSIRKQVAFQLSFSVWDILHKGLPTFLTFLALSLAAFFYPQLGTITFQDIIPEPLFEKVAALLPFEVPSDALYRTSIDLLQERFRSYERYLPAVFALGVFAAFRTVFIAVGWASIAFAWLIIKMLLYAKVVAILARQVSQEYIEFK